VRIDAQKDTLVSVDTKVAPDTRSPGSGQLVVIGHDFFVDDPTTDQLLGNAILLPTKDPLVVITFEGGANPISIGNAKAAVDQTALAAGRTIQWTSATEKNLPSAVGHANVLLVFGQENATDADLAKWAGEWKYGLTNFVRNGGTIVLLDGSYTGNSGTCQIANLSGLLAIAARYGASGTECDVVASTDPLASNLAQVYVCPRNSVRFTLSESGSNVVTVVTDGDPVVVEKLF
jgi:hypothetical protein